MDCLRSRWAETVCRASVTSNRCRIHTVSFDYGSGNAFGSTFPERGQIRRTVCVNSSLPLSTHRPDWLNWHNSCCPGARQAPVRRQCTSLGFHAGEVDQHPWRCIDQPIRAQRGSAHGIVCRSRTLLRACARRRGPIVQCRTASQWSYANPGPPRPFRLRSRAK